MNIHQKTKSHIDIISIEKIRFKYFMTRMCHYSSFSPDKVPFITEFLCKNHETFGPLYRETMKLVIMSRYDFGSNFSLLQFDHMATINKFVLEPNI